MRRLLGTLLVAACMALLVAPPATAGRDRPGRVEVRQSVVDPAVSFRGLDALDRRTAWVAGARSLDGDAVEGAVYRTRDGGRTWSDVTPPGAEGLQFRDVELLGKRTAVVLAIGEGDTSRIYRTTDGGRTWTETYRATDPRTFLDCLDFYRGGRTGLVMGDPVDGKFQILRTDDGGASWELLPSDGMPDATGEYGFAASGDCLVVHGRTASFGSGGSAARVFSSTDRGLTWTATDSTLPPGPAAGVFGLAFDRRHGVVVGGDFEMPEHGVSAVPAGDGWERAGDLTHLAEDAAFLRRGALLATGESGDVMGTSWSADGGQTWRRLSDTGFHTLDCTPSACFAAGGKGRVAVVTLRR
jgi:photosystem II stability/assembly factor-like uncharacterized protein